MKRRNFIKGAGIILAAPAIVKAEFLMPVRELIVPAKTGEIIFEGKFQHHWFRWVSPENTAKHEENGWVEVNIDPFGNSVLYRKATLA